MIFPVRTKWLAVQAALNGVILGVAAGLGGAVAAGLAGALIAAMIGCFGGVVLALPKIRIRHLVVDSTGLIAIRNGYQLRADWSDLQGFESGRFLGLRMTLLRVNNAALSGPMAGLLSEQTVARIRAAGADRAIQLGLYVEDPSAGEFGTLLRRYRPDLAATLHSGAHS